MPDTRKLLSLPTKTELKKLIKQHGMRVVLNAVRIVSGKTKKCAWCGIEKGEGYFYSQLKPYGKTKKRYLSGYCKKCSKKMGPGALY